MEQKVKLAIEYDGTEYVGWQRQHNGVSIQEIIERSLKSLTGKDIVVFGAGRTDAGVHALGQVAHFMSDNGWEAKEYLRALNGVLPDDIAIVDSSFVEEKFHARYSAVSRRYQYNIMLRPSAIQKKYSWQIGYALNIERIEQESLSLIGSHNFRSFCRSETQDEHYLCNITEAGWKKKDHILTFSICGNRFLHGMVRSIVGTLVDISRGRLEDRTIREIMDRRDRTYAGQTAPAKGLFLTEVTY